MSMMKMLCRTCKSEIWVDVKEDEICNSCKTKTPEKEPMYKIFDTKEQAKEHSKQFMEPELMTLQEAIYKMAPGETFKPIKDGLTALKMQKSGFLLNDKGNNLIMSADAMKIEGRIMPAEPKVLTFREWFSCFDEAKNRTTPEDIEEGFNSGDKNGKLKEWLNHKELRETVEDFTQQLIGFLSPSIIREYQDRFKALLNKLKEAK